MPTYLDSGFRHPRNSYEQLLFHGQVVSKGNNICHKQANHQADEQNPNTPSCQRRICNSTVMGVSFLISSDIAFFEAMKEFDNLTTRVFDILKIRL